MLKRDKYLITLDQTIAYKNTDLQFVEFTEDALAGKQYAAIVPLTGEKMDSSLPVICTRSRCLLEDNKSKGIFIHVMLAYNPALIQLTRTLQKKIRLT